MRIALWHNLPSGGGKRALYDQVRGLLGRGHSVEAWCPPTADREYLPVADLITEHVVPLAQVSKPSFGRLGRLSEMRLRLRAMNEHCRLSAAQIAAGGFDLLFVHPCTFFRTVSIARHLQMPSVLYLQEPYRWLYEAMPSPPWMAMSMDGMSGRLQYYRETLIDLVDVQARRVQVREEVLSARAFDRILVNSFYSRESVLRAYGLDAHVCYLGIDATLFVDQGRPRQRLVIGLGAFVPEKNVHLVIEALGRIADPPHLLWIGNVAIDAYVAELRALAARCGVPFTPRVRISDVELVGALNQAAAMVYAPRLEPFGYAPLEANACGVPVVAVAEGGVRETVQDGINGILTSSVPGAIAEAVSRVLADGQLASTLASHGKRLVHERWSLDMAADRLEAQLADVVCVASKGASGQGRRGGADGTR
jgi:glycosyltransferase involved in cell wall biosynthesis